MSLRLTLLVYLFMSAAPAQAQLIFPIPIPTVKHYGAGRGQVVSLWESRRKPGPLVVMIADGVDSTPFVASSWYQFIGALSEGGMTVAVVGTRDDVQGGPGPAAADVAAAVAYLDANADALHIVKGKFAIMAGGHSGGIAAALGCDPVLLQQSGIDFSRLAAVAIIDGRDFDQIGKPAELRGDPNHDVTAAPNAESFYFINSTPPGPRAREAEALANKLAAATTKDNSVVLRQDLRIDTAFGLAATKPGASLAAYLAGRLTQ